MDPDKLTAEVAFRRKHAFQHETPSQALKSFVRSLW